MAETIKLSGTYDSIEAYNILTQVQQLKTDTQGLKNDAQSAATNAQTYAGNANTYAGNAQTYAGNAQTYAGNANSSAGEAAGYAANAHTSETNAGTSETNASNSAGAAAQSALDAQGYAGNAQTYAGNASNSASAAAASAASVAAYVPTGCVQAFAGSTTPTGWLLCDGSAVSRTDYADLYAVIGDTYGAGDGSTTFNLPNLIDKFVEGSATSGTVKSAGLPNITGSADNGFIGGGSAGRTGAISQITFGTNQAFQTGTGGTYKGFQFDASKSNSIYGNSTTVQPPAVTMRYIIKT